MSRNAGDDGEKRDCEGTGAWRRESHDSSVPRFAPRPTPPASDSRLGTRDS